MAIATLIRGPSVVGRFALTLNGTPPISLAYLAGGCSCGVDRGRTMALLATRGRPHQCTVYSRPQLWTTRYTTRTPALVVDEIEDSVRRDQVARRQRPTRPLSPCGS